MLDETSPSLKEYDKDMGMVLIEPPSIDQRIINFFSIDFSKKWESFLKLLKTDSFSVILIIVVDNTVTTKILAVRILWII